jgi:hypothetical protein
MIYPRCFDLAARCALSVLAQGLLYYFQLVVKGPAIADTFPLGLLDLLPASALAALAQLIVAIRGGVGSGFVFYACVIYAVVKGTLHYMLEDPMAGWSTEDGLELGNMVVTLKSD